MPPDTIPTPTPGGALRVADFDFHLPPERIAQHPAAERTASRLLDARQHALSDRVFRDLPQLLEAGDLLVFNDTKVIKARLFGSKASGGRLELLVERVQQDGMVLAHLRASKKPRPGDVLAMDGGFTAELLGRWPDEAGALFRLRFSNDAYALMERHGHVPLPPYIRHADDADDARRYQTVFAREPGSVAAPTAALHFDEALLTALEARGVRRAHVTLHVGAGTFQPVKGDDITTHHMHSERYAMPAATLDAITQTRESGGRIVAVGTTTVRTLETVAQRLALEHEYAPSSSGHWPMLQGETNIFITPGYAFQMVDLLITNFHLPRSTLLMLVSAFAGTERIRTAYAHAVAEGYRFFSYGDAMLLGLQPLPQGIRRQP
ncbi:MAG: tRNA preQ1(34) S-adenosylmethionine ribosyltransferase-isomerase QueA [Betaproteobacteria bacterium]|nr:tRNA preQ1(34) S-adenosylmethionine ribosyltransferase-isomerase QueA [Betaproteobacteria bacterium]MDE2122373.1 tRNA preQ1(34) S-adenosylmethionine ribosyltransferase-isomerase QueA [Betaproteobacteria bacterium]MDE2185366.1 tRNA preQ1(34) S-adenosylmethionine ribosyltransferase-isomerase QueA [Betaproteobacteria bacterium]MDE2323075.1 tRNA preQ1(34) S-adenosylmethionine ribosyltransferase-isomerase QueA [Betaproteobacteria bacterium]